MPALLSLAISMSVACDDNARPLLADFDVPSGPSKSLRATFDYIRTAYDRKAYLALRPYLDPDGRDQVIDFLLAVDGFQAANRAALQAVERACPEAPREWWADQWWAHLSYFEDKLELSLEPIDGSEHEDLEKGTGMLSVKVAGQSEFPTVNFRRRDGNWVYDPGPHVAELIPAFRDLTKSLDLVTRSLGYSGHMTPEQVAYQYDLFVAPRLARLRQILGPS